MKKKFIMVLLIFSILTTLNQLSRASEQDPYYIYRDQIKKETYWIPEKDLSLKKFILNGNELDLNLWGKITDNMLKVKKNRKYLLPQDQCDGAPYEIHLYDGQNTFIEQGMIEDNNALSIENFDYEVLLHLTANQNFKLNIDLRNQKNYGIDDIETELLLPEDNFHLLSENKQQNFAALGKKENINLKYTLYSRKDIESKIYDFNLIIKYTIGNTIYKERIPFKINITDEKNINGTPTIDDNLSFNDAEENNKNNNIEPDLYGGGTSLGTGSRNENDVDDSVGSSSLSGQFDGETIKNKPKLIVDNYGFTPSPLQAGQNFKLTLSFYNTNKDKSIRNIRIVLNSSAPMLDGDGGKDSNLNTTTSSVFTPIDSSNTFYIDYIGPKDRKQKTITLTTPRDIAPQTYELSVALDYEDKSGNEFNATEVVGIPIIQETKLELGVPELPTYMEVDIPQSLSLDFYNTGKSPLYNLMINTTGDFETEGAAEYLGNFQPGNSESYDVTLTPTKTGVNKGEIKFTYEDVGGNVHEMVREFSVNVEEQVMMDEEYMDSELTQSETSRKGFIWIILALIAAGILTAILLKKNKKKHDKDLELDE